MTIKEVLDRTTNFFKEKKFDSPRLDAELLIAKALGLKRIDLYLKFESPLSEQEISICRDFVRRRSSGEPVAYILEEKEFFGEKFYVDKQVLIPRPETEILVEKIIEWVKLKTQIRDSQTPQENEQKERLENSRQELSILDIGSGSGCIGISLLKNIPESRACFIDLSKDAIQVAQRNAQNLGVIDRCEFIQNDAEKVFFENKKFDIILANPPYISKDDPEVMEEVKKYEPHIALFSEEQGLYHLQKWISHFSIFLMDDSVMGFECGSLQGQKVKDFFNKQNIFENIQIIKDLSGLDRHVIGYKNSR